MLCCGRSSNYEAEQKINELREKYPSVPIHKLMNKNKIQEVTLTRDDGIEEKYEFHANGNLKKKFNVTTNNDKEKFFIGTYIENYQNGTPKIKSEFEKTLSKSKYKKQNIYDIDDNRIVYFLLHYRSGRPYKRLSTTKKQGKVLYVYNDNKKSSLLGMAMYESTNNYKNFKCTMYELYYPNGRTRKRVSDIKEHPYFVEQFDQYGGMMYNLWIQPDNDGNEFCHLIEYKNKKVINEIHFLFDDVNRPKIVDDICNWSTEIETIFNLATE